MQTERMALGSQRERYYSLLFIYHASEQWRHFEKSGFWSTWVILYSETRLSLKHYDSLCFLGNTRVSISMMELITTPWNFLRTLKPTCIKCFSCCLFNLAEFVLALVMLISEDRMPEGQKSLDKSAWI